MNPEDLVKKELLDLEDKAKSAAEDFAKKWLKEELKDTKGFQGKNKDVIALGASFAGGALVSLAFSLLNSIFLEDTENTILNTLNDIKKKLDNMSGSLDQLHHKFDQSVRGGIRTATTDVRDAIGSLLSAMKSWPANQLDKQFEVLVTKLDTLNTELSDYIETLVDKENSGGHLWETFERGKYPPLDEWGPYYYPWTTGRARWDDFKLLTPGSYGWGWGLQKRYNGGAAKKVPKNLGEDNVLRPDPRAGLTTIVEALVTALIGYFLYDPALRTTGANRERLKKYAVALHTLAEQILGSIQVARPIQLPIDEGNWQWGNGLSKNWNYTAWGQHHILAGGWPVGAIDTLTGAHIFHYWWKPAQHGFLAFAWANSIKGPLSGPLWSDYVKASLKASEFAEGAWSKLAIASGAFDLVSLSHKFDELATPPTSSETVWFEEPVWHHTETADGTEPLPISGLEIIEDCLGSNWAADAVRLNQRVTVTAHIQPKKYRFTDVNPSAQRPQFITYRFWLRAGTITPSGLPADIPPSAKEVPFVDLSDEEGSVTFSVPTFYFLQSKPPLSSLPVGLTLPGSGPIYNGSPANPAIPVGNVQISGPDPGTPVVMDPFAGLTGAGIGSGGRWFWSESKQITLTYKRTDFDGRVVFVFEHNGPENTLLWLEVEEDVGNLPDDVPGTLSSWQRLEFVGRRLDVPWGYFQAHDSCLSSLLAVVNVATAASGEPPIPDPKRDLSPAGYFTRVDHIATRITGRSLRELHLEMRRNLGL